MTGAEPGGGAAPPPAPAPQQPQKTPQQLQQEALMAQMPTDRPAGVTMLGILYFIKAGIAFAFIAYLFFYGLFNIGQGAWLCILPYFFLAMFYIMIATMLYMMKSWAWMWALIFAFLGMLNAFFTLWNTSYYDEAIDIPTSYYVIPAIQLVLNLVIIFYLYKVKDQFSNEPIQMPAPPPQ